MKQVDDQSLIRQLPSLPFLKVIENLNYKQIVRLCNTSTLYQQFCDDEDVWDYLLRRDFNPLLQVDIDALDAVDALGHYLITTKKLYYRIQQNDVNRVIEMYKKYESGTLIALCDYYLESYYGVQWLINVKGIDPSEGNNYPLYFAARSGHINIVKLLLNDSRVDPSVEGNCALSAAVSAGNHEIVKLLLNDPRVNPSDEDNKIIIGVCILGDIDMLIILLQNPRTDPTFPNNKPLKQASMAGRKDIVRLLLTDARVIESLSAEELARIERRL